MAFLLLCAVRALCYVVCYWLKFSFAAWPNLFTFAVCALVVIFITAVHPCSDVSVIMDPDFQ